MCQVPPDPWEMDLMSRTYWSCVDCGGFVDIEPSVRDPRIYEANVVFEICRGTCGNYNPEVVLRYA